MLEVFICEDNDTHRLLLEKYINDIILIEDLDITINTVTKNPIDIINTLKNSSVNGIYFLDIELKNSMSRIKLAQTIRKFDPRGFIVFVSTRLELSYLAFAYKIEALGYIVKGNFNHIKEELHLCLLEASKRYVSSKNTMNNLFNINIKDKILTFQYNDILYFETSHNKHKILLHTKNSTVEFYGKLKDIESLNYSSFIRVHNSFIVNKDNIKSVDKKNRIIHMKNNKICLASTRLLKNLL